MPSPMTQTPMHDQSEADAPTQTQQPRACTATVGGVPMRWLEAGEEDGVAVVLIHGIPTSPLLWRRVMPLLQGARVLAFEMIGYGESIPAGVERDISVRRQSDYVIAWLEHLGVERAVLAGHDLGGGVAQLVAARQTQLCAGLFLTNSIGYDSWPIPSVKALQATAPIVRQMPALATKQILRTLMYRGHDQWSQAREALDLHWEPYLRHGGAAALMRQMQSLDVSDTIDIEDALRALRVPARIVWGAADPFQKIEYGERFAKDLQAPLVRIDGGHHFTPEDHPQAVAQAINELVALASGREMPASSGSATGGATSVTDEAAAAVNPDAPDAGEQQTPTSTHANVESLDDTDRDPASAATNEREPSTRG